MTEQDSGPREATWQPEIEQIALRRDLAREMGGADRVQEQHDRGNLTVRERIELLTDDGSFRERGVLSGAGYYDESGDLVGFHPSATVTGTGENRRPAGCRLGRGLHRAAAEWLSC